MNKDKADYKGYYFYLLHKWAYKEQNSYICVDQIDGEPVITSDYYRKSVWKDKDKALKYKGRFDKDNQWTLMDNLNEE